MSPLTKLGLLLLGLSLLLTHASAQQLPQTDPRIAIQTRVLAASRDEKTPRELEIKTALVSYLFSEAGGTLNSVYLYFSAPWGAPTIEVLADTTFPFTLTVGPVNPEAIYQSELIPSESPKVQRLVFTHQHQAKGLKVQKTFTIVNDPYYTVGFELRLENLSETETLSFSEGFQLALSSNIHGTDARFLFDGMRSTEVLQNYRHFDGVGYLGNDLLLWLSNDPQQTDVHPWVSTDAKGRRLLGVRSGALALAPGEARTYHFALYAGRLRLVLLEHLGLQKVTDFGLWTRALTLVTKALDWLYDHTGNYGWALILLTLIIRLLMYPLTRAQFHSMAKMKEIQPKLEKLQARYPSLSQLRVMYPKMSEEELKRRARENREELAKKQMDLYRKEGVNPMGGCLPALLQIPIFILLWRVILYSAETIHLSPGFLWMSDLSLHDPFYIIVALTVLAQIAQGKLTPAPASGQNQVMTWLFPIVFGFWLKDLSAGLWLHYFVSTLVQVGQQVVVTWELRRRPKPAPSEPGEVAEGDGPQSRSSH